METVEAVAPTPISVTRQKYALVNGTWPAVKLPALTAAEAIKAFRVLYRHRFHKPWGGLVVAVKGAHRRTWNNGRVIVKGKYWTQFNVAPDQGWHDFVHDLSHWIHRKQYPEQSPHKGSSHAAVERDLIEQVVNRGWLDGRLKSKARATEPKAKPDIRAVRAGRVAASIKRWEAKRKRAETALRKLRRQARHYERVLN